ncbi:MAG TPA: aldehyde dehydrogenase family protein, partial [Thermoplasmata archaeon]|nr:aldehyde dehydrogenase family protein [Thermoplasmata archaeon]
MVLRSVNPATGEELERFEETPAKEVDAALTAAEDAFRDWRRASFADRAERMHAVADVLRRQCRRYAKTMALEMGKPVRDGVGEAEKCAWACEYYADHAAEFLADEPIATDAKKSLVRYEPLGPVLAVMPWNFPFWQVFRFAAPALAAGNAAIVKHSANTTGCALRIEQLLREAG